jgi:hypothetical protein
MSFTNQITICCLVLACSFFIASPADAFTADSLDITVDDNGDAVATFRFTLQGIIENSIPQSMLEAELKKGLTTSEEPPELLSMDRSGAVLLLKKFAALSEVPSGTEYRTVSMDFKKAEIALQGSSLSSVVSADFSPERIVLTFPDSYTQEFTDVDVLPAVFHTVIDPARTADTSSGATVTASPAPYGSINVTSSPLNVSVYLDSRYIGEAPAVFSEIAPGTHILEFTKDAYSPVSRNVSVLEGKTTNILVVLEYVPAATTEKPAAALGSVWLVLIIALIAIAGGGYYYWSVKQKNGEREDDESADESE